MPYKEFEGKTPEDAVRNASRELSLPKDKLRYDVISYGSTGIFGLVRTKKARIRVSISESHLKPVSETTQQKPVSETTQQKPVSETTQQKTVSETTQQKPVSETTQQKPVSETTQQKPVSETTQQKPVSETTQQKSVSETTQQKPVSGTIQQKPISGTIQQKPVSGTIQQKPLVDKTKEVKANDKKYVSISDSKSLHFDDEEDEEDVRNELTNDEWDELAKKGEVIIKKILSHVTIGGYVIVKKYTDYLLFTIKGGNSNVLIGKHGYTLESLQYIIDKILNKNRYPHKARIKVDVEGYIKTKEENLVRMTQKVADKVKRTGRPETLPPLNLQDRRVIHFALRNDSKIKTQSVGGGYYRKIVLFANKRPNS